MTPELLKAILKVAKKELTTVPTEFKDINKWKVIDSRKLLAGYEESKFYCNVPADKKKYEVTIMKFGNDVQHIGITKCYSQCIDWV